MYFHATLYTSAETKRLRGWIHAGSNTTIERCVVIAAIQIHDVCLTPARCYVRPFILHKRWTFRYCNYFDKWCKGTFSI